MKDINDKLAGLRSSYLERDDESDPGGRIYRDKATGEIFHSVTRILSATKPPAQQKALERWKASPGAAETSAMACNRGHLAHSSAEYVLKTATRLARSTANKRGIWKLGSDGLYRCPSSVTKWAIEKAIAGAPPVGFSGAGYARSLRAFIHSNVTAIHGVEFFGHHPAGFAGACDALLDLSIDGEKIGPMILDWKTTGKSIHSDMSSTIEDYSHQAGAYSLMVKHLTGIICPGAAVVVARRTGNAQPYFFMGDELRNAEECFLERCARYYDELHDALRGPQEPLEAACSGEQEESITESPEAA